MISDAEQALLSLLRANARASTAELARQLGVSRTTVQSRIERLEQRGIIAGYGVRLAPDYEQGLVRAHVLLTVTPKLADKVVRSLQALPPVQDAAFGERQFRHDRHRRRAVDPGSRCAARPDRRHGRGRADVVVDYFVDTD